MTRQTNTSIQFNCIKSNLPACVLRTRRYVAHGLFGDRPTAASKPLVAPHPEVRVMTRCEVAILCDHLDPQSPSQMVHLSLFFLKPSGHLVSKAYSKGWGMSVRPACHGSATSFPGQTPAVPGGRGHHSRHYQRSECGDRLCSYGNNVRCSGDRPIHGLLW